MLGTQEHRTEELIEQAYHRGYKTGYNKAFATLNENLDLVTSASEEKGRNEAWEVADKLNRMRMDEVIKVFENDPLADTLTRESIFSSCSPELAIEKVRAYEEQKKQEDSEIHVGDEVILYDESSLYDGTSCIVTKITIFPDVYCHYSLMLQDGGYIVVNRKNIKEKTGRTFPQIAEVLKKMQENDTGRST